MPEKGIFIVFLFGKHRFIFLRFIALFIFHVITDNANDIDDEKADSKYRNNEDDRFGASCAVREPCQNNCKVNRQKNEVYGEFGNEGGNKLDVHYKIAKSRYYAEEEDIERHRSIDAHIIAREYHFENDIERHDYRREIHARMTEKTFDISSYFIRIIHFFLRRSMLFISISCFKKIYNSIKQKIRII